MDSGVRGERKAWAGFDSVSLLIDRMTAEAQAARDAHGYNEWETGGKVGKMREDWVVVMDRAAAKFGTPQTATRQARGVSR